MTERAPAAPARAPAPYLGRSAEAGPAPVAAAAAPLPLLQAESRAATRALPPLCDQELAPADAAAALAELDRAYVQHCEACVLGRQRRQTVFGTGNPRASLVFVGEGPGADEDAQGLPFVGAAGQLLTRMIAAMSLTRDEVFICNIVKCRPPGNRTPLEEEITACLPYLLRQLCIVRPRVIVALGRPASQTLLASTAPISQLRGNWFQFPPPQVSDLLALPRCPIMPTFHPSYLLRVPQEKAKAWSDLQMVMAHLGLSRSDS